MQSSKLFALCCLLLSWLAEAAPPMLISSTVYKPRSASTATSYDPSAPSITNPPRLLVRDSTNVCGYWSTWVTAWETRSLACDEGVSCVFASVYPNQAIGYCAHDGTPPITQAFDYGSWPSGGCLPGQMCCNSDQPSYAIYVFNNGASSFTQCASSRFYQTATATIAAITATTVATSVTTTTSTPSSDPSKSATGSGMTTGQIIGLVFGILGGIGAFAGGVVGILKYCRKRRLKKNGIDSGGNFQLIHRGPFSSAPPTYTFHAPVTVNLHNSEVHLTGGSSGLGANMRIGENNRHALGGRSSSRLIAMD